MIALQANSIQITYGSDANQRTIVRGLNFQVNQGECIALIGANGAGKSSLLRVISGLQKPTAGEVKWNGTLLDDIPLRERPKFLANMFSKYHRMAGIIVRDMVSFGRQPYTGIFGKLSQDDWKKVDESIQKVGMAAYAGKVLEQLSDGEFRKVMLAKMWAQDAPIMILDEPTSHLDLPSSIEFIRLMRDAAHANQKTIVYSSHNLALAFKFADKILALDKSGNTAFGTPKEVLQSPTIQQMFQENSIEVNPEDLSFKYLVQ